LSTKIAVAVGVLIVLAAAIVAANVVTSSNDEVREPPRPANSAEQPAGHTAPPPARSTTTLPPASAGTQPGAGSSGLLKPRADSSWAALESAVTAEIGLAVVGVGSGAEPQTFGPLQSGHAWSSIKVPIVVTLMNQRESEGREFGREEQSLARAALTASDNAAAASLFDRLEEVDGGLDGASRAVSETLNRVTAEPTEVATAPPPPGAASRYGQTEWSLSAAAEFFAALDAGCLASLQTTGAVLSLMGEVVPEQQWGLASAGFPNRASVAYKAGWGPEGSSSGPYLVRQSGIVALGDNRAVAVAMIALGDSGSFEAGVKDLNRIAGWLAANVKPLPPQGAGAC
jgi:hypothetical protein